jgi:hypothetical protein
MDNSTKAAILASLVKFLGQKMVKPDEDEKEEDKDSEMEMEVEVVPMTDKEKRIAKLKAMSEEC